MLTYQVRPRIFRTGDSQFPEFPLSGEIRLHLAPRQPFGVEAGGGRTAVMGGGSTVTFNANNGEYFIVSKTPLQPLDVTLSAPDQVIRLEGARLTVSQSFESLKQVAAVIDGLYFAIPALLAVEFADPPFVERVDGTLGGVGFRWELEDWAVRAVATTQVKQEQLFAKSWERLSLLADPQGRRLFAALHYFHTAARLARVASVAGEFLPEILLNLSKVLEVLFPPGGDGMSRNAARAGLKGIGISEDEIESDYLPAMVLRNEIDVGHVDLSLFAADQLQTIHGYTERAEAAFRRLLSRVLTRIEEGTFVVAAHDPAPATGTAVQVIDRLRKYAADRTTIRITRTSSDD
ncbi:hypothetical protein [Pelomonas sp. SE-A7]|uniref:hypothetical protein n=1 Tax=Pelomonas sp. SE-A7 TaxID=3054953 RepID=UPI00259CAFAA|nr:hypothetical protein [Pelomonas sp. SE-A7]MDM4765530.1 hypothetical protein [Pelomonas sp. SE-A7]